jgi:hypothetical protein
LQNLCATIAIGDKCTSTSARLGTSLRLETGINKKNKKIKKIKKNIYFGFFLGG